MFTFVNTIRVENLLTALVHVDHRDLYQFGPVFSLGVDESDVIAWELAIFPLLTLYEPRSKMKVVWLKRLALPSD